MTLPIKEFKTGSRGFYANGKIEIDGKRYQAQISSWRLGARSLKLKPNRKWWVRQGWISIHPATCCPLYPMPTIESARAFYTAADPVHDFDHILRVLALAERVGRVEGADLEIVRAAVLLHDASGATPARRASAAITRSRPPSPARCWGRGWPDERRAAVQHCIRAHRFRSTEAPRTLEAKVLFDCDKLDVLGAIARCVRPATPRWPASR